VYEAFYGLKEKPFNLNADPAYLFMSQAHKKAYAHLEYAMRENKGFVVITGEIGSGKTTLIHFLLRHLDQDVQVGLINQTDVPPETLLEMICNEFELQVDGMQRAKMMETFHQFLLNQFGRGKRVILLIDEAQNLPSKTIESIRMLSNLESEEHPLLQMVLIGQPELKRKLQGRDLKQFAQRVSVYYHLQGLKENEVAGYISHRLRVAGAKNPDVFHKKAIEAVYECSCGIPRMINILCDTALVYGYADELKSIDRGVIDSVVEAREKLGIPSAESQERGPVSAQSVARVIVQMDKRLRSVEHGVHMLEMRLSHLEEKLKDWSGDSTRQYRIVLELLNIIRTNGAHRACPSSVGKRIPQLVDTNRKGDALNF
jgi:general secretion pathway protein A